MKIRQQWLRAAAGCFSFRHLEAPEDFFIPRLNRCFFIRLAVLIGGGYLLFGYICIPAFIKGASMEPTYNRIGFDFCWRPAYWFKKPKRGDIVIIRYTKKRLFLKRIVAFAGERVAFLNGTLYINGKPLSEPYVKYRGNWNLPERTVAPGHIYVVGDNRGMPMEQHKFGQVTEKRLYGAPLW